MRLNKKERDWIIANIRSNIRGQARQPVDDRESIDTWFKKLTFPEKKVLQGLYRKVKHG